MSKFSRPLERALGRDKSQSKTPLGNRQSSLEEYWRPLTFPQVSDADRKPATQHGNIEEDEEQTTIILEPRKPRQAFVRQVDQHAATQISVPETRKDDLGAFGDIGAQVEGNEKLDLEMYLSRRKSEWAKEEDSIIRMLVAQRDEALAKARTYQNERDRALRETDRLMKEGASFNPLKRLKPAVSKEEILRWAQELQQEDSDSDDSVILGPRRKKACL